MSLPPNQLWYNVYLSHSQYHTLQSKMRQWCDAYCKGRSYFGTNWSSEKEYGDDRAYVVNFTTEEDAVSFSLKWL